MGFSLIAGAIAVFLLVIAPIWIGAHYLTRWRVAKSLSPADEERLAELWRIAERLEDRLDVVERILDEEDDSPNRGSVDRDRFTRDYPERND